MYSLWFTVTLDLLNSYFTAIFLHFTNPNIFSKAIFLRKYNLFGTHPVDLLVCPVNLVFKHQVTRASPSHTGNNGKKVLALYKHWK